MASIVAGWGPRSVQSVVRAREVVRGRFTFIGQTRDRSTFDWTGEHVSRLWTYNLHYFDFVVDLVWAWRRTGEQRFLASAEGLVREWINDTQGGVGPGWEPYTTSVRTTNWAIVLLLAEGRMDSEVQRQMHHSLYQQLCWLERHIEWDILANHLQRNLQALSLGGLLFRGRAAGRWRKKFIPALWKEVLEQVLPDGGHFERSPMYHLVALADFLEFTALAEAAGVEISQDVVSRLSSMSEAVMTLCRPDGRLHLFNDAAEKIAPDLEYIDRLSRQILDRPTATGIPKDLPTTGYFACVNEEKGFRLLVDCGDPGPAYQAGHAHCDLLSFELDLDGRAVVVDSGVSGYDGDPLREYVRSTRAHNTVTVDGLDQSEMWATFRVGGRASEIRATLARESDRWSLRGGYRPYHDRKIRHERAITVVGESVDVVDQVINGTGRQIASYLHLHPDYAVRVDGHEVVATSLGHRVVVRTFGIAGIGVISGVIEPEPQGWYCPEFGRAVRSCTIRFDVSPGRESRFGYRIESVSVRPHS